MSDTQVHFLFFFKRVINNKITPVDVNVLMYSQCFRFVSINTARQSKSGSRTMQMWEEHLLRLFNVFEANYCNSLFIKCNM